MRTPGAFVVAGQHRATAIRWTISGRNVSVVLANVVPMATEQDYHIVAFNTGQAFLPWRWELRRRSSPMGVMVGRGGYHSKAAAEYDGKRVLEGFLKSLAREERQRK